MSDPPRPPGPAADRAATAPPPATRTGRAVALGVAVLGLLSLVALASQGPLLRARTHNRQGRLPGWTSEVFTILVVLGAALFLYGAVAARRDRRPKTMKGMWSVLIIVALAFVVALVMHHHRRQPETNQKPVAVGPAAAAAPRRSPTPSRPPLGSGTTWLEVLALATAAVVALGAATRPRRVASARLGSGDLLVALVDDSLEDVRAEPDPRRAVIAAYARMERGLGATGLPRDPAETPLEYLARVLAGRRVSPPAVTRLTSLFQPAKFSDRPVGPGAKQAAIAALEAIRDELRNDPTPGAADAAAHATPAGGR